VSGCVCEGVYGVCGVYIYECDIGIFVLFDLTK